MVLTEGISIRVLHLSISPSIVHFKLSVVVDVFFTQSWLIWLFRRAEFLMFPVFTPTFHLSLPTYLACWFPPCFSPGQLEVFNLLPIWAAPSTTAKPSNYADTVIELSVNVILWQGSWFRFPWLLLLEVSQTGRQWSAEELDLDWREDVLPRPCGYLCSNQPYKTTGSQQTGSSLSQVLFLEWGVQHEVLFISGLFWSDSLVVQMFHFYH